MKLNLKKLQAIDNALNLLRYPEEGETSIPPKFKLVVSINGKLVTGDFLLFQDNQVCEYKNLLGGLTLIPHSSNKFLFDEFQKYLRNYFYDHTMNNTHFRTPEFLLTFLLDRLNEFLDSTSESEFNDYPKTLMHNVEFLESNTKFDYIYLDDNQEYEIVSLI